jgi:predicted ester cyclase
VAPEPLGADAHVEVNQGFHRSFPGYTHVIEGQTCDDDMVTTWGHIKMKHSAEFQGIPATNKEFDIGFIDVAHVVDGQVREEWAQVDVLKLMTEVGAVRSA